MEYIYQMGDISSNGRVNKYLIHKHCNIKCETKSCRVVVNVFILQLLKCCFRSSSYKFRVQISISQIPTGCSKSLPSVNCVEQAHFHYIKPNCYIVAVNVDEYRNLCPTPYPGPFVSFALASCEYFLSSRTLLFFRRPRSKMHPHYHLVKGTNKRALLNSYITDFVR